GELGGKKGGGPHAEDAVVAAGEGEPLAGARPDDLREGERQHGEVDAGKPHGEPAEEKGTRGGQKRGRKESRRHGEAEVPYRECRTIGAKPEIGGMAERDQAARAHDEMEARG